MAHTPAPVAILAARPEQAAEFIRLRGQTRENAVSEERLRSLGITAASWGADVQSGRMLGCVGMAGNTLAGYCFGDTATGEVVVLAVLPAYEGQGLGARLLRWVIEHLQTQGHTRLFLGCARDPAVRSYGFYRHLGWRSTGTWDDHGDEILEWCAPDRVPSHSSTSLAVPADKDDICAPISEAAPMIHSETSVDKVGFAEASLYDHLNRCTSEDLDRLDFGVIGIDSDTLVRRYNSFESKAAGLSPQRVLGQPLFTVVAPCMNNFLVAQRFEDAKAHGEVLDATVDYVLTLRMRPVKVKLRLLAGPNPIRYVLVQRAV